MEELQVKKKLKPTITEPETKNFEIFDLSFTCSSSSRLSETKRLLEDPLFGDVHITCKCDTITYNSCINLKLIKSCTKPAIATIRLQLRSMDWEIKILNNWITECEFKNIPYCHSSQTCLSGGTCSSHSNNRHWARNDHEYSIKAKCKIIWYGFVHEFYSPNSFKCLIPYSEDMDFCDMKIKVENKEFPAHKITVSSHSSVLKKTLTTNMKESKENCIDLTDLGANVVEELLLFLYESRINKAEEDDELLLKLLKVGEMYQIFSLKNCCGMLLSNKLTEENVLMLLENAHIHNSSILQARAIAFIVAEREKIFSRNDFKEFALRLPELLFEICSMLKLFLES